MKAIIFDMDGVLLDTEPLADNHMVQFLKNLGIKKSDTYLRGYIQKFRGSHAKYAWENIINDFKLTNPIDELISSVRVSYLKYLKKINLKPNPGVITFLKKIKKEKYTLAIASSAYHKRIDILLERCDLKKYFDLIVSGDHVKHGKPDPEIYLATAKLLKISPQDCIVFEDAINGIAAAKAAGMKVIGYIGQDHNKQDLSQADKIIKTFVGASLSILNH